MTPSHFGGYMPCDPPTQWKASDYVCITVNGSVQITLTEKGRQNKISAIKAVREFTSMSLKEALDFVNVLCKLHDQKRNTAKREAWDLIARAVCAMREAGFDSRTTIAEMVAQLA